jgi:hypothetical protein
VVTTETKRPSKLSTSTAVALVKPVAVSSRSQAKVVEWELVESRKEELIKDWAARLNVARYKIQSITQQYKKLMLNFLQEAYAVYAEVEAADFADEFYANVRWQLKTNEIEIQSNTPDAGLAKDMSTGQQRTLYSLRHTYATTELLAGTDIHTLARQMGTSVLMLERHYSKLTATMAAK